MKKIVGLVFGIIMLLCIPYILKFAFWLIEIDNTEFGFPVWLDIGIGIIAGSISLLLAELLFSRKSNRSTSKDIFSIIIGFIVGVFVHCILKYWYIWLIIILLIIAIYISLEIKDYKTKKNVK